MRPTVHVAAMPFPTLQGTQAAIASMLRALDGSAELVTYGRGLELTPDAQIRRARPIGTRDAFRSGPSLQKIAEDAALLAPIAKSRGVIVAHHVEAALGCLATRRSPLVYFAHTDLGAELPVYGPTWLAGPTSLAGRALDRIACRGADAVAAVSPALARRLTDETGVEASFVPVPWPRITPIGDDERIAARRTLSLGDAKTLLYAGNLDAYQGLDTLIAALPRIRAYHPDLVFVVASATPKSIPALGEHRFVTLAGEAERRLVHAAADVVAIPRRTPGGLPIKLLDAIARGVPVVATTRACAGLIFEGIDVAPDDDPAAFAEAIVAALHTPNDVERAREQLARDHSDAAFKAALERVIERAIARA